MTALVDRIEAAFIEGRNQWDQRPWEWVDVRPLLDVLAVHAGISEWDAEPAISAAFRASITKWGPQDWAWQTGDVAEAIAERIAPHLLGDCRACGGQPHEYPGAECDCACHRPG